jgi:hypothetical protein
MVPEPVKVPATWKSSGPVQADDTVVGHVAREHAGARGRAVADLQDARVHLDAAEILVCGGVFENEGTRAVFDERGGCRELAVAGEGIGQHRVVHDHAERADGWW